MVKCWMTWEHFPAFTSDTHMKAILRIAVIAVLVFCGSSRCSADQVLYSVSTAQRAQELGVKIRWKWNQNNTNEIEVALEVSPHTKLARFHQCILKVASDRRELVSATLRPVQQTNDNAVLAFTASRDFLPKSSLTLFLDDFTAGYCFAMKDFVEVPPVFTFIGVPRPLSTNTLPDITVDVLRVTEGTFSGKQVEFPFRADWPWPPKADPSTAGRLVELADGNRIALPKAGIKYSITAGYGQHDHVRILEYHEIK